MNGHERSSRDRRPAPQSARAHRAVVAGVTLLGLHGLLGCDEPSPVDNLGSVGISLAVSPTVNVNTIQYSLTGNGITPITGSIDVSGGGATASASIGGVPAGTGYQVEMTAQSVDGQTNCDGKAAVDVQAGQTSAVTVLMQCRGPAMGGVVVISGGFDSCPSISSFTGAPISISVGGSILVSVTAVDPDSDPLTYLWSAPSGTFAAPSATTTQFTCTAAGMTTLTVTVSDGTCDDAATLPITCVPFCSVRANGTPCNDGNACTRTDTCQGGQCVGTNPIVCPAPDQCHLPGTCDPGTGTCTDLGAPDGAMCMLPNSTAVCTTGACGVVSCATGFDDCNRQATDGCETSLATSPANCGQCGRACPGAGATCVAGLCVSPPPSDVATATGGWRIGVQWSAVSGATSYEVLRAPMGSTTFTSLGTTTGTQFFDEAVASGTTYQYGVKSISVGGSSALSSPASAIPLAKQLCVSSDSMRSVMVYDATQSGTAAPLRIISGSNTTFGFPKAVATDLGTGELYVSLLGGDVLVFPFGSSGNVGPTRTLTGASPGQAFNLLALDPDAREVFTADFNAGGSVDVVDGLTGALKRSFVGPATQLGKPESAVVDRVHGELLVGQLDVTGTFQQIQVFQETAGGNTAPLRTLGSASVPAGGFGLAYDKVHDEVFATCNCNNHVDVYSRTASGGASPSRSITVSPLLTVYSVLLDPGNDSLWLFGNAGFGSFQLVEVPRASTGPTAPLHPAVVVSTTGGRLAPCN